MFSSRLRMANMNKNWPLLNQHACVNCIARSAYKYCFSHEFSKYKWFKHTNMPIVYKHWPDIREFTSWTVELWNRWIRLSCHDNRLYNTCPLHTHVTPIV